MKRKIISAVYEDDLEKIVQNLGLLDEIKKGEIRCSGCSNIITLSNVRYIFRKGDNIHFCCDKMSCAEIIRTKGGD